MSDYHALKLARTPEYRSDRTKEIMNAKTMLRMGFLSMMVATGIVNTSGSFVLDVSRADVIERIGQAGSIYPSNTAMLGDCFVPEKERLSMGSVKRIGHGGSTYYTRFGQARDCNENGRMVDVIRTREI